MNCGDAGERLADYLYRELSADQQAALQQHIDECPCCSEQVQRMRAVTNWLDRFEAPLPEPGSPVPLLVRQAADLRRNARRWRRTAVSAAALAAGVLLALTLVEHIRWEDNSVIVDFGGKARREAAAEVADNANAVAVGGRLELAEQQIRQLREGFDQLVVQQRELTVQQRELVETVRSNAVFAGGTLASQTGADEDLLYRLGIEQ